jgi:phosphoglycolate phosphatase-like HAD superfamily hydrolase
LGNQAINGENKMENVINLKRKHDHLICLDSDGCAIDGMTVKHIKCFGPCAIEEWKLEKYQDELLEYWLKINLYTLTRGINRFKGLLFLLQLMKEKNYITEDIQVYEAWVNTTTELSNASLEKEIERHENLILQKALSWSKKVNIAINNLREDEKLAFLGVKDALKVAHQYADIAVISAANAAAVEEEWRFNELIEHVDVCMTQEYGSKAECIHQLIEMGEYEPEKVIMLGDALGDYQAAEKNNVLFYPIKVAKEVESWSNFRETILKLFIENQYSNEMMQNFYKEFKNNLG